MLLQSAGYGSANMSFVRSNTSSKSEISNFWSEVFIEKNVAVFNISVDYFFLTTTVKIR